MSCERMTKRLGRRFFRRGAEVLSVELLGQVLVRVLDDGRRISGKIVEVEAYLGADDMAAHTYKGRRTERNASMFLDGGCAYVYFTYGMHWCMNVVSDVVDEGGACLVRALEPGEGLDVMRERRSGKIEIDRLREVDLCSGPAKLCQALCIDKELDGEDMVVSDRLFIERGNEIGGGVGGGVGGDEIVAAKRVGVGYAGEWAEKKLRFYLRGNRFVSRV